MKNKAKILALALHWIVVHVRLMISLIASAKGGDKSAHCVFV